MLGSDGLIPALGRQRQEDLEAEIQGSQGEQRDPVSERQDKKRKTEKERKKKCSQCDLAWNLSLFLVLSRELAYFS